MVYQPPAGARDLLPLDVVQKRWIENRLQQVFHRWGYHRIITSTLERLDTLMAGGAIERSTVIQLQDIEDDLGLRPELTASIARAAVTRMAGATHPLRLYYNANVFRRAQESSHSRQQEYYQAGVELLGAGGLLADAEVLLLLVDCLQGLGLERGSIVLGEAGLTRSLLSVFPAALQAKVRHAIAHLDRIGLEALPLTPDQHDRALQLFDLRGHPPDVLERISQLDLDDSQQKSVHNLRQLVDLLQASIPNSSDRFPFILDLSLIRTFDYYTGIVFEVVSEQSSGLKVLGQGGRYDQLLGLYHPQNKTYPGIGFSLQIEDLYHVLLAAHRLPEQTPAIDWLVVAENAHAYPDAFTYAQKLRSAPDVVRVELELGQRTPADIHDYARHRRIAKIAWVKSGCEPVIETLDE